MQPSYYWFQQLDQFRRAQGRALDRLGLGPQETPFHVVFVRPGVRLRCYGGVSANRPALLIVPAPIKRPYIWDLSRDSSVIRRALENKLDVYMVEWTEPEPGPHAPGLADYAAAMLGDCIAAIRQRSEADKVFLAGHSMGGIFAALHSAYRPQHIAGLVVVDAPLHFADGAVRQNVEGHDDLSRLMPSVASSVPGSLLGMASARAQPRALCMDRYQDCMASLRSRVDTVSHWRVERWTLDELAMSGQLFDDVMHHLYRHNRFMRGELTIGGVRLHPRDVTAPLCTIFHSGGGVVPADSVLAFHTAAGSGDKQLIAYPGDIGVALQHVDPLVGTNAHRHIWPRVFEWLERLSAQPPPGEAGRVSFSASSARQPKQAQGVAFRAARKIGLR